MCKVILLVSLAFLLIAQSVSAEYVDKGVKAEKLGFKPGQQRIDMREIYGRYWDLVEVYEGIVEDLEIKAFKIPCYDERDHFVEYREDSETHIAIQNLKTGESHQYQELAIFKGLEVGFPVKVYVYTRNNGYLFVLIEFNNRYWIVWAVDPNYNGP